jgi:hypothetical protein
MPEIEGSWNQSDWSGGSGQELWSDTDKFNYSGNINATSELQLSEGGGVHAWKKFGDSNIYRDRHRVVWNPTKSVFYVFGGEQQGGYSNDLYEYNPTTNQWSQKGTSGGPNGRASPLVVYDTGNDLLWVYGGRRDWDQRNRELWAYNPNTDSWTQYANGPEAVCDHAGAYIPTTGHIVSWGGYTGSWTDINHEVWLYNITTNSWWQMHNYTKRYYNDAVWCPKTETVLFHGGASAWSQSGGWTFMNELNEYFPATDTWVNRTPNGDRVRMAIAWDTLNEKMILHGGNNPNRMSDTWYYDVDADQWARIMDHPNSRERHDGDWDTKNNQFVIHGGRRQQRSDDVWVFNPNVTSFDDDGGLVSSVFSTGARFNPKMVSFNLSKPTPSELGANPVKIRIAGADTEAKDATFFVGWDYSVASYFSMEEGRATPSELNGIKYLAYKVNASTENVIYTPKINWIRIDYFTYPDEYIYDSSVYPVGPDLDLPLRYVNWTSVEPDGTSIEIYFRQASDTGALSVEDWEKVTPGQTEFGFTGGKFLQYRVVLKTTEPGYTPEISTIKFIFNAYPTKPDLITPMDEEWVGTSRPTFTWKFNDPDEEDYQTGLQIYIAIEDTFTYLEYSTNELNFENNNFTIDKDLEEGEYYWKIMLRDNYGSWSPWSDANYLIVDTGKPTTPKIESFSHPLEHIYYSNNRVDLHWNEPNDPSGIAGYSYILNQSPDAEPVKNILMTNDEFKSKYSASDFKGLVTFDNVADGTWYFHLIASDALGTWSEKATRTIKVDTVAPIATDYTPNHITSGQSLKFIFKLSDALSGVDISTISWRYETDVDYQFDELIEDASGNFSLQHQVKTSTDNYIEYYIDVADFAESPNMLRYPKSATMKINLDDTEPPVIIDSTGSKTHNQFANLEIFVKATDNVGVSEAKIYFNDQASGKTMTKGAGNVFTFQIDRVELTDYSGYSDNNSIKYKLKVWDYHNNTDSAPDSGDFIIQLEVVEEPKDEPKDQKTEDAFSGSLLLYLLLLIVIIVVVFLVLFMFIRKSKDDIDEDRHKLRMAIADVTEAAAAGSPQPDAPPTGIAPMVGGDGQAPAIDIQAQTMDVPSLEPQDGPVGYLPEAPMYSDESIAQPTEDQAAQQAGLMAPTPQPQPQTDMPQVAPTPEVSGTEDPEAKVNIDDGLSVSLPGEEGAAPEPEAPSPNEESSETVDKKFWKPPEPSE